MNKARGRRLFEVLKKMVTKIIDKNLFTESAALSYYFALSLVPLLILTLSILSFLGQDTLDAFQSNITTIIGPQGADVITNIIIATKESPHSRSVSEMFGIIVLLISASSVFSKLKEVLSNIFEDTPDATPKTKKQEILGFLKDKALSIFLMVVLIFLAGAFLIGSIIVSFLFSKERMGSGAEIINQVSSFIVLFMTFGMVFYFGPKKKVAKYNAAVGGVVAAIGFLIGKYIIATYLTNPAIKTAYGIAGSFIVLLAWVYYSAFIFFVSAVITKVTVKPKENLIEESLPRRIMKNWSNRKKYIVGAIVVLLVAFRMALPFMAKSYLNNYMANNIDGYSGHMDDFDLSLLRGAYQVQNFTFKKKNGKIETPFIEFKNADISIAWKGLFQGKILANLEIDGAKLNFVDSAKKSNQQFGTDEKIDSYVSVYEKIVPFNLEQIKLNNGEIHFKNDDGKAPIDIFLNEINLVAKNIHNTQKDKSKLFSKYEITAKAQNQANLISKGSFDMLSKTIAFDVNLKLEKFKLVQLNKFLLAYGPVDLTSGTLFLYTEVAAKDGKIKGYIKPLFEKVDVVSGEENINSLKRFGFEYGTALINLLFRSWKTLNVATKIPFEGDMKNPDFKWWDAVKTALANGWTDDKVEKKLDHDVNLISVDQVKKNGPKEQDDVGKMSKRKARKE